jgi:hypothetical protein
MLMAMTSVFWLVLNFVPRTGVGPRMPPKPPGFELERYFGWPAAYRADLWESDDPKMADHGKGSFRVHDPSRAMSRLEHVVGIPAAAADALFILILLVMTGVGSEAASRDEWRRRELAVAIGCAIALALLYLASDSVSVTL